MCSNTSNNQFPWLNWWASAKIWMNVREIQKKESDGQEGGWADIKAVLWIVYNNTNLSNWETHCLHNWNGANKNIYLILHGKSAARNDFHQKNDFLAIVHNLLLLGVELTPLTLIVLHNLWMTLYRYASMGFWL